MKMFKRRRNMTEMELLADGKTAVAIFGFMCLCSILFLIVGLAAKDTVLLATSGFVFAIGIGWGGVKTDCDAELLRRRVDALEKKEGGGGVA